LKKSTKGTTQRTCGGEEKVPRGKDNSSRLKKKKEGDIGIKGGQSEKNKFTLCSWAAGWPKVHTRTLEKGRGEGKGYQEPLVA